MTTLPNMGITLPTRGAGGAGLWGDTDDANSSLIDGHDHSSGKGVRIKTAGISLDADLSFSSLYAPINLARITFASVAALSSNNKSLFVSSADSELYWRSNAGANVKLTSGSSLNVAAFTGGIGGDYTAVGAAVAFDDAGDRYTFKQQANVWARMASGEVRILETGTSETVFVGQAAPAALAASYTMTWPTALPGAAALVSVDNTGQFFFNNTIQNAAVFNSTVNSIGLITATAGLTAAVNQNVTVSGTGTFKQGTKTINRCPGLENSPGFLLSTSSITELRLPELPKHYRIINVTITFDSAANRNACTGQVTRTASGDPAVQTFTSVGGAMSNAGTAQLQVLGLNASPGSGEVYFVKVSNNSGVLTPTVVNIIVDYDVP